MFRPVSATTFVGDVSFSAIPTRETEPLGGRTFPVIMRIRQKNRVYGTWRRAANPAGYR